jgi:hypothetical protein
MSTALPAIPIVDVRDGGPLRYARQNPAEARALRDACLGFFPRAAMPLVPALDGAARRWLKTSRSPYVTEIGQIADALDFSGIWMLNASYQWGCTSRALTRDGVPWLIRTLDWPFKGLGRHVAVARMRGEAGEFFNATWPGYVGALTAMAPGRFAASINQAPMWRRTAHKWLRPFDFVANALDIFAHVHHMPPDQLLRQVFETCRDYSAARRMLETTPVARPVMFILIGCAAHEGCIIERTETDFVTREDDTCRANDWVPSRPQWEGRIGTRRFLVSSFEEARNYSKLKRDALARWDGSVTEGGFDWVCPPVLNPYTRLAVAMSPAKATLRVVGYEPAGDALPEPATQVCDIAPVAV